MNTPNSIPWEEIKTGFLSGQTMRSLARQFNVGTSTISERAKKDRWKEDAKRISEIVASESERRIVSVRVSNNEKAAFILNTLMEKMEQAAETVNRKDVVAMKSLVASMKDLRDLGAFDVKKQNADIEIKLQGETDDLAN